VTSRQEQWLDQEMGKMSAEVIVEASSLPLAEMKNQILNRVAAWRHGHAQDDVSLVLLEIS